MQYKRKLSGRSKKEMKVKVRKNGKRQQISGKKRRKQTRRGGKEKKNWGSRRRARCRCKKRYNNFGWRERLKGLRKSKSLQRKKECSTKNVKENEQKETKGRLIAGKGDIGCTSERKAS